MQAEIVALGEPIMEFNALDEGDLSGVSRFERGYGGDTSNFAVAAARSGARVAYVSRVGADPFGDAFMRLWQDEGIDVSAVERDPLAPTGIYFNARQGKRHSFTYYRAGSAASLMTPRSLPVEMIQGARLLHVSGISQGISATACDTVFEAINIARASGVTVSYDPNLRPALWPIERARAVIHATAAMADILLPSIEDAHVLTGLREPEEIVAYYRGLSPARLILKLGAGGALVDDGGSLTHIPPHTVEVMDTAGAGDTFCGALAAELVAGGELVPSARYATAAAALACTGIGCVVPIPVRSQIQKRLPDRPRN